MVIYMARANTTTGHTAREESDMDCIFDPNASISYVEACEHATENWRRTNGMVIGGGYNVRFDDGSVRLVDIRISKNGIARLV
jgi:UDP-N-acetylenolpyruvoylglucosamine reductase